MGGKTLERLSVGDLHFYDLRGAAVTRLALSECMRSQVGAITGYTLNDVQPSWTPMERLN